MNLEKEVPKEKETKEQGKDGKKGKQEEAYPDAPTTNEKEETSSLKIEKSGNKRGAKKTMVAMPRAKIAQVTDKSEDLEKSSAREGATMDAEAKKEMEREIDEIKEEENDKDALMKGINSFKSGAANQSIKPNDFHFSMSQYLCDKSESRHLDIYRISFIVSPDGAHVRGYREDLYGGRTFKNRIEFWQTREILIAKIVIAAFKIRMKMKYEVVQQDTGYTHWVDDQWIPIEREPFLKVLGQNSIDNGRLWNTAWKIFYTTESLRSLGTVSVGNNTVLVRRSIGTLFDQGIYKPRPRPYLNGCFTSIQDIYNTLRQLNLAGNYWTIQFDKSTITSDKNIGLQYVDQNPNPNQLFSTIATQIPGFRNMMYLKCRSVVDSLIELRASAAAENVRILADNLNLVLNNVSNVNALPQDVFSANAKDIFSTLVAGSVMSKVFKFVYDINPSGAYDLTTWASIFAYLIYTPQPLLDPETVFKMKTYLWNTFLGAYSVRAAGGGNIGGYQFFDPNNPDVTIADFAVQNIAVRGDVPFNSAFAGITDFQGFAASNAQGIVANFFRYNFAPLPNGVNGDIVLYPGLGRYFRYTLVLNFIRAVGSLDVFRYAINNNQRNQVIGFSSMIRNQYVQYSQFTLYLANVVQPINRLLIFDFDSGEVKQNLEINYDKFLALTVKLDYFRADFVNTWYRISAWAVAIKVEIGMIYNLYAKYWDDANYYANVNRGVPVMISRGDLSDFLKPVIDLYKVLFSTEEALWVFEKLPTYMKVTPLAGVPANVRNYDVLDFEGEINLIRDEIRAEEELCGYVSSVVFGGISAVNAGQGMQYISLAANVGLGNATRFQFSSDYDPTPVIITSDDPFFTPIGRVCPKLNTDPNFLGDTMSLVQSLRDGNSINEIPLYYRWAVNSNLYYDNLISKPPLIMPITAENFENINDVSALVQNDNIEFYNNSIEDVKFTSSKDFDTFFKSVRIH